MINSRSLHDLQPDVEAMADAFIALCTAKNIDVLVTSTLRDFETQAALYAQGRTTPGKRVTNAQPGDSAHNYGMAFDVVPLRDGKPVWGTETDDDQDLWETIGELGEEAGLDWAGRWKTFREYAHFQRRGINLTALKLAREAETV